MISEETIHNVMAAVDADELIALTAELVRINSVWDPDAGTGEQAAAACAARWARQAGFDVEMQTVAPGRPNVIVSWTTGNGPRTLMFEGHTDVVTPGEISAWNYDPFGAEIVGGRMFGRGTNDTKGNLAAMLQAMRALKRAAVPLDGTIVAGVLCDEEGGMAGVRDFIRRGHADRVTAAIICEPQDGLICTRQKGAIRACYTVTGRMSHGAMPLAGLNPAPAVARLIDGLHDLEQEAAKRFGCDEYLGWPSFTPTVIQAPSSGACQLNVVPGQAQVMVDVRTIPGQSHPQVAASLQRLARSVDDQVREFYQDYDNRLNWQRDPCVEIDLQLLDDRPCTRTDHSEPLVQAACWATGRLSGHKARFGGVPGATDGTFLWAQKNIPIVTMGAGDRLVPHQVDEWVDLDQLVQTARIYALTALNYLHPGYRP